MTASVIRNRLQEYLAVADLKKINAFYTMFETDIEDTLSEHELSPEQINEIENRRKEYMSGLSKTIPWEKAKKKIGKPQ